MPRNTKAISENIQKQVLKGVTEKYKPNYPSTVLPGYFTGYPRNPKNMPRSVRNVGRFNNAFGSKEKGFRQKMPLVGVHKNPSVTSQTRAATNLTSVSHNQPYNKTFSIIPKST